MIKTILISVIAAFTWLSLHSQQSIEPPVIERVTVLNASGHVGLEWSFPSTTDIDGYILYWKDPTKYPDPGTPFDTVFSGTSHIDLSSLANNASVYYSVAAFKIDGTDYIKSPQSDAHATIHTEATFDSCQQQNVIYWNDYVGWENEDLNFRVYSNSNEIETTRDTFFVHENIELNEEYTYYVIGQNNVGKTTASSRIIIETDYPEPPEYINADYATVVNNEIIVSFTIPVQDSRLLYKLVRTDVVTFTTDTLETYSGNTETIEYTDTEANVLKSYEYHLFSSNTCNASGTESNVASNVVLTGAIENQLARLSWTEYTNWLGDVQVYEIYRDQGDGFKKIGETQTTSFIDNTNNIDVVNANGVLQYYVVAIETAANPYGIQGESQSNVIDIVMDLSIEFPTAFTPNGDGKNDFFKPLALPIVPQSYEIVIFDRWGMPVFKSNRVDEAWNGTGKSGKPVMEGVYNYQVTFNTADGNQRIQSGYITVLYP